MLYAIQTTLLNRFRVSIWGTSPSARAVECAWNFECRAGSTWRSRFIALCELLAELSIVCIHCEEINAKGMLN